MRARPAIVLGVLVCAGACERQPTIPAVDLMLRVTAGADAADGVEPGRGFPVTVVRVWSENLVPSPAEWDERPLAPLAARLEETVRREDGGYLEETRRYLCHAFSLTDVVVPSRTFRAAPRDGGPAREVSAPALRIRVKPEIDPAAPGAPELPGEAPPPPSPWALAAALAAAVLAAAFVARRMLRRRAEPDPAPFAPVPEPPAPHVEALERLAALRRRDATAPAARGRVVAEACDVVRAYVAARFSTPALERSSEEVVGALPPRPAYALRAFLAPCDRTKFAGHVPAPDECARVLDAAEAFVREGAALPGNGTA